jgi:hypothetical protein
MSSTSLKSSVRVGDGTSGIVVQMDLDVTAHNASECPHQVVHLSRVCAPNGIRNTDAIYANFVYSLVDAKKIDEVGSEGVFGREADFNALGLDKVDDFDGGLRDVSHVFSMREFTEERGGSDNDIYSVDT